MDICEEKICSCALNRIFGFSPKTGLALLAHFGSASEVFRASFTQLREVLGTRSQHIGRICKEAVEAAAKEVRELAASGIQFAGWNEDGYPPLLKECPDAPLGLYIRSTTKAEDLWKPAAKIAVVGTRDISPYGKEWCTRTVSAMASAVEKPMIISGLALGIDFCAHRTALESGLPTIAVMATGPETIYPYRHKAFAEKMCCTPGCALVTDYPPGTAPLAMHFLRRNRIIAGMSDATILMESKIKGGGLMTSRLAFSYSRDVYALPGRIDDIRSQGCNRLIRDKIAEPIVSTEDLLESLGLGGMNAGSKASVSEILLRRFGSGVSEDILRSMESFIKAVRTERGITLEEAAYRTGMDYSRISYIAGMLEMEGLICTDILQRCFAEMNIFG